MPPCTCPMRRRIRAPCAPFAGRRGRSGGRMALLGRASSRGPTKSDHDEGIGADGGGAPAACALAADKALPSQPPFAAMWLVRAGAPSRLASPFAWRLI